MISADTRGCFPAGHVCGLLLAAVMVVLTGCIQIEETIEVKENGSGKLTEVIRFDDRLIQTTKRVSQVEGLAELLGEARLKERMALYGDVTLASHEVHDLDGKGQE